MAHKKMAAKHKKHASKHTKIAGVKMTGHGVGSNLKMPTPENTVHVKPKRATGPSRRETESMAGTSELPSDTNLADSGET